MYRTNSSRILPIIIMVIVTIALIVGMVIIGRRLFGGNSTSSTRQSSQVAAVRKNLLTIDAEHSVVMNVRGPLVANENFRSYEIKISPDARSYTTFKGYDDVVTSQKTYGNLTNAYKEFVYALQRADYSKPGRQSGQPDVANTNGICATGDLYTFTIYDSDSAVDTRWTSTCAGSTGSFGAAISQVGNLFAKQIPGVTLDFGTARFAL